MLAGLETFERILVHVSGGCSGPLAGISEGLWVRTSTRGLPVALGPPHGMAAGFQERVSCEARGSCFAVCDRASEVMQLHVGCPLLLHTHQAPQEQLLLGGEARL